MLPGSGFLPPGSLKGWQSAGAWWCSPVLDCLWELSSPWFFGLLVFEHQQLFKVPGLQAAPPLFLSGSKGDRAPWEPPPVTGRLGPLITSCHCHMRRAPGSQCLRCFLCFSCQLARDFKGLPGNLPGHFPWWQRLTGSYVPKNKWLTTKSSFATTLTWLLLILNGK